MDGPPAVALGIEKRNSDVMNEPPRELDESLPNGTDMTLILLLGLVMVLGTAAIFWFAGGGIITGEPCLEYDGRVESEYVVNGICNEDLWMLTNFEPRTCISRWLARTNMLSNMH